MKSIGILQFELQLSANLQVSSTVSSPREKAENLNIESLSQSQAQRVLAKLELELEPGAGAAHTHQPLPFPEISYIQTVTRPARACVARLQTLHWSRALEPCRHRPQGPAS